MAAQGRHRIVERCWAGKPWQHWQAAGLRGAAAAWARSEPTARRPLPDAMLAAHRTTLCLPRPCPARPARRTSSRATPRWRPPPAGGTGSRRLMPPAQRPRASVRRAIRRCTYWAARSCAAGAQCRCGVSGDGGGAALWRLGCWLLGPGCHCGWAFQHRPGHATFWAGMLQSPRACRLPSAPSRAPPSCRSRPAPQRALARHVRSSERRMRVLRIATTGEEPQRLVGMLIPEPAVEEVVEALSAGAAGEAGEAGQGGQRQAHHHTHARHGHAHHRGRGRPRSRGGRGRPRKGTAGRAAEAAD